MVSRPGPLTHLGEALLINIDEGDHTRACEGFGGGPDHGVVNEIFKGLDLPGQRKGKHSDH
ncbi:MAG: Uncharacterised protein [Rhodospirillaceae bacterium]|nr:MAG: Uncharacterised protein [Rhodospirillaceae bacterium]